MNVGYLLDIGSVAQWFSALPCRGRLCEFKSRPTRHLLFVKPSTNTYLSNMDLKNTITKIVRDMLKEQFDEKNKSESVVYEVQLDKPDYYVEFFGPPGLSEWEILEKAIEEMISRTEIFEYKVRQK
jgi:hypothetical protein